MIPAKIDRYEKAIKDLTGPDGLVYVVPLILAVPIERRNMSLLRRTITCDFRTPAKPTHNGIDFNAGPHAGGYAPLLCRLPNARVIWATNHASYGNVIDYETIGDCMVAGKFYKDAKVRYRVAHLHNRAVTTGQTLSLWTEIGKVGSTGNSTAPHEHFEVFVNGTRINPHHFAFCYKEEKKMSNQKYRIVKSGDRAWKIAEEEGITLKQMAEWNPHVDDLGKIFPGDKLYVSAPEEPAPETDSEKLDELLKLVKAQGKAIEALEQKVEEIEKASESRVNKLRDALK